MDLSSQKRSNWLCDERGFTIQELMVVLIVGSMLVSFTLSLFLFTNKLFISWHEKRKLEDAVMHSLNMISLDVTQSKHVEELTDSTLTLTKGSDRSVRYVFRNAHLSREGVLLENDENVTLSVTIVRDETTGGYTHDPALKIKVSGKLKSHFYEAGITTGIPENGKTDFMSTMNRK